MLDRYVAQVRLLVDVLPDVAALDRQHLRDLFDVKLLYENEGLTDDLFRAFMVYVAGSRRPMHELLAPAMALRDGGYDTEFAGMTRDAVSPETLIETGRRLQADIRARLTGGIATFLLSLHDAEPEFARTLATWLDSVVTLYGEHILTVNPAIARRWGQLSATIGHDSADLLIAATALEHGLAVVTRNVRHFQPTGVPVVDPSTSAT